MSKKALALILCLMLSLVPFFSPKQLIVRGATVFGDGFESGTLLTSDVPSGHWDSKSSEGSGAIEASSDQANSGAYSCKIYGATVNDAALMTENTETNPALTDDVRFYMRLTASFNDGDSCEFAYHQGAGAWFIWKLAIYDLDYKLALLYDTNLDSIAETISSTAKVSLDTWHCFEVKFIRDNGNGEYHVYLDGNEVKDLAQTGLQTGNMGNPDVLQLGNRFSRDYSSSLTSYYDDVVWADSYIGPELTDTSPPTFGNVNTNTTTDGQPCGFSCLINDNSNVSTYVFSTNNTGSWINETVTTFSSFYNATAAWANVTKTLDGTAGDAISYLWYANDTSSNWSSSNQYSLTVTVLFACAILSPNNTTYPTADVPLTFTISEIAPWMGYSLDGQGNVTIVGNATLPGLSDGSHRVIVYANDTLGNMDASQTVYFTIVLPDIAVINLTASKTVVGQGLSFNVSVTAENNGDSAETFNITSSSNQTIMGEIDNVTLTSGDSIIVSFTWNTTSLAYGNYTISAYAWPLPDETNTANNNITGGIMEVTIPGDVSGDLKVSLQDLVLLANAYGTTPASGGTHGYPHSWNPNADIDNNGVVGLPDLVILALHYGQHYP